MNRFCKYSDICQQTPCLTLRLYKYSYLKDFLEDSRHRKAAQSYSVPLELECVKLNSGSEHKFEVNDERCINCMFCIFGCPENKIGISSGMHPYEFCHNSDIPEQQRLHDTFESELLTGRLISLPAVKFSQSHTDYRRFEDFTGVHETKNIAVWTANILKFLSSEPAPRIALEVGVEIAQRARGGRLDVCLLNTSGRFLFIAETKVSFDKMMQEGRYESQMMAYETELKNADKYGYNRAKFLVIGGRESDMLHPDTSAATSGARGRLFYDVIVKHALFFFSAQALLALALKKLYVDNTKYSLESIYRHMTCGHYAGMLSCGFIRTDGSIETY